MNLVHVDYGKYTALRKEIHASVAFLTGFISTLDSIRWDEQHPDTQTLIDVIGAESSELAGLIEMGVVNITQESK